MARTFGVKSYTFTITAAEVAQPLMTDALIDAGHQKFTDGFRVALAPGASGQLFVGDSGVTTANAEPINPSEGLPFAIEPKVASISAVFDLSVIYVAGSSAGDSVFVTYISKAD